MTFSGAMAIAAATAATDQAQELYSRAWHRAAARQKRLRFALVSVSLPLLRRGCHSDLHLYARCSASATPSVRAISQSVAS